jgi:chaperonin GroES
MFEKFKPLGDRVLIQRLEGQDKTAGGIFIPDAAKEKAQIGAVLAVGPGRMDNAGKLVPMYVKEGDRVYFGKYAGTEVTQDRLVIREEEILGIVEV